MRQSVTKRIVDRLFGLEKKSDLGGVFGLDFLLAPNTASGQSINPATALKVPAVSVAVAAIAGTIGSLPAKVYASAEGLAGKRPDPQHPAYSIVHDDANEWTSAAAFRKQLTTDALMHGNGFAFANRVGARVIELNRLDPCSIEIASDPTTGEPIFKSKATTRRVFSHRDILHIQAPLSLDGICGLSPIVLAREAIALSLALEAHAARLFARGGRPSGVITFPAKVGTETLRAMSDAWHATHAGEASGKTAFLQEGGNFVPLAFNAVDSQFEEMRRFQIEEIARAFSIPPTMLFELTRGTWSNVEQMAQQFYKITLLPWLRVWEAAYRRVLLTPDERQTYSIDFIVDDFLRADTATRAAAQGQYRSMGVLTANEVRAQENLPALPGGDVLQNPYTTSSASDAPPPRLDKAA